LEPGGALVDTRTVAVIVVPSELTLSPEKLTPAGPVSFASELKPLPVTVNVVLCPGDSDEGATWLIDGPARTVRQPAQDATPPSPLTTFSVYEPGAVPCGTVTFTPSELADTDATVAFTPVAGPVTVSFAGETNPLPLTVAVTLVAPCPNAAGEIELTVGCADTCRHPTQVVLIPGRVTVRS
jgi:hypothetical protein